MDEEVLVIIIAPLKPYVQLPYSWKLREISELVAELLLVLSRKHDGSFIVLLPFVDAAVKPTVTLSPGRIS